MIMSITAHRRKLEKLLLKRSVLHLMPVFVSKTVVVRRADLLLLFLPFSLAVKFMEPKPIMELHKF